jgi:hypothetical protein
MGVILKLRRSFWDNTFPKFDTSTAIALPPVRQKVKEVLPKETEVNETVSFNVHTLKFEKEIETNDKNSREWENMKTSRQKELTKSDIEILRQRGLNVDKARVIKPFFAIPMTRAQILYELKKRNLTKGYSSSIVGNICAALAYANKEDE